MKEHAKKSGTTPEKGLGLISAYNHLLNSKFKRFMRKLAEMPESRKRKSYCTGDIFGGALAIFLLKCESRNCYNNLRCDTLLRENYSKAFGCELPHGDSIDRVMRTAAPKKLEDLKAEEVSRIIRSRHLSRHRLFGEYYTVSVDATGMAAFSEKHCDHCLHKTYKKSGRTVYFHYILEAKLVTPSGHAISMASEFIENPEGGEYEKQDCEQKAFIRLASKLKSYFPRLPICLLLDGLYATAPVFDICQKNSWAFITTLKEDSLKSFQKRVAAASCNTCSSETRDGKWTAARKYAYTNGVCYKKKNYTYMECVELRTHPSPAKQDVKRKFAYITNLQQDASSVQVAIRTGRLRWKIENEGFNAQKNNGYGLEHKYSRKSYRAMQNYYHIMQLAHMLEQFALRTKHVALLLNENKKSTVKDLWDAMKAVLRLLHLTPMGYQIE